MKLRHSLLFASLLASGAFAQYAGSTPPPADLRAGFEAIKQSDAKTWLEYLAGPECMGRGSLQPGYLKAAEYMAARFKEFGLKPAGDNGTFFQGVPSVSGKILDETKLTIAGVSVSVGSKLSVGGIIGNLSKSGEAVLLEAKGASAKVPADVKGKVVLAYLDTVPRDFRRNLTEQADFVIEVSTSISSQREFRSFGSRGRPNARLHPDSATEILTAKGLTRSLADGVKVTVIGPANILVSTETTVVNIPNVVAMIEGSDPKLKGEYVGIGAHLDHLGTRMNGDQEVVYWGADDDGSGSTALLNVAKAMAANPVKPKRSVLFMAFTGEEMGLVGSRWLADHPMFPIEKMTCELQMDMVGRNSEGVQNGDPNRVDILAENIETMRLVGSQRISTELHKLVLDMNQHVNFKFKYDSEDVYTRSDHYSFAAKGIPIAFLFDGFHPDYHRPTDTVDKINFDKLTNAARLFYLVAMQAANRPAMLARDVPQSGASSPLPVSGRGGRG